MNTQRRCPSCHIWYDKKDGDCPGCGHDAARFNKHLRTSQLNNHLYESAANAKAA